MADQPADPSGQREAIETAYREAVRAADRHHDQDLASADHGYNETVARAKQRRDDALAALEAGALTPAMLEDGDA